MIKNYENNYIKLKGRKKLLRINSIAIFEHFITRARVCVCRTFQTFSGNKKFLFIVFSFFFQCNIEQTQPRGVSIYMFR